MSSLFNQASLVVEPAVYETSKVYATKPFDGSGDLTFTRTGDTATRVGPDGLIEKVRTNLILHSEDLTNAAWTKGGVGTFTSAVTTGFTDPTGGSDAQRWLATIATVSDRAFIRQLVTLTNGIAYNVSFWIKSNTASTQEIYIQFQGGATATIVATTSWTRVSYAQVTSVTSVFVGIDAKDLAIDVLIYGFQIETGDVMTDYIPTTTTAVSVGPVANFPRLDYLGSTCPKLLLEPQRTNLVTFSEQFNNAAWTKSNAPTITTNIATSPDGTLSADGIQAEDGINYKTITQTISVASNSTLTLSFFVKKETSETAFGGFTMFFQGVTNKIVYGIVNAVTGAVTYTSSTLTATTKVESYGNYWRISSTATDNGSNTLCLVGYYGTLSTNGTSLDTGAGSVRTLWGFQAEVGSYATSYIPTLSAAVTRGADVALKDSLSVFGTNTGSFFVDAEGPSPIYPGFAEYLFDLSDNANTGTNRFGMYSNDANTMILFTNTSTGFTISSSARKKILVIWSGTNTKVYANGIKVVDITYANANPTSINLNSRFTEAEFGSSKFNQVLTFPTALTNAQAIELTTI